MKGYKGMTKNMTCRGMQFEVGKTYHVDGKIELCSNGLHFCKKLRDCFNYYSIDSSRYFEVCAKSPVTSSGDKSVTAELTIVKELSDIDVYRCFYGYGYGDGYGYGYGDGYGNGDGYGGGYGYGYGDGNGDGYGGGYGNGYGYGYGNDYGNGYGDGNGYGYGNGKNVQKILQFIGGYEK